MTTTTTTVSASATVSTTAAKKVSAKKVSKNVSKGKKLPPSASQISKRGIWIGEKGLTALSNELLWGDKTLNLSGTNLEAGITIAKALKEAWKLAQDEKHIEACKKARGLLYMLRHNPTLKNVRVTVEGMKRNSVEIIEFFANGHERVAKEVALKRVEEKAALAAKIAEAKAAKAAKEKTSLVKAA